MRHALLASALILASVPAFAQTPLTGTTGAPTTAPLPAAPGAPNTGTAVAPSPSGRSSHRTLQERFDEANVTHDGHLTREQAHAKMPVVYRNFDKIDTAHAGYVTVDQIREAARAQRAERRAQRNATPAQN